MLPKNNGIPCFRKEVGEESCKGVQRLRARTFFLKKRRYFIRKKKNDIKEDHKSKFFY